MVDYITLLAQCPVQAGNNNTIMLGDVGYWGTLNSQTAWSPGRLGDYGLLSLASALSGMA
ncbi:hypothetical protein GCM10022405_15600 [Gibbsiella dentisursi]|uniref:Uncharacterized protein n=1 Tax=Gibbsiella dentisursi TaxID=796890 RepID=A0ABP7L2R2_9GAMM